MACSSGDKHVDDPDGPDNPGGGDEYEDIQVVNGKVRFYLREAENSVRKAMGTGGFVNICQNSRKAVFWNVLRCL